MKKFFRFTLVAVCATLAFSSCVTPSQVNYLQDMRHGSQIELENKFQAVICPYDELDIYVFGTEEEDQLIKPFNIGSGISSTSNTRRGAYLVDVNGNIQFPILGQIHVAGLTRLDLQDTIKHLLEEGNYLKQPVIMVRFANFKIFFLGAEGGKSITISNERCTFLEALALSGDLSIYTNRNKISKVFNDPFFMLQQNDFIITQNYNTATTRTEARNFIGMWAGTIMSTITLAITIINLTNKTK